MASSLHHIASNILTRPFHPVVSQKSPSSSSVKFSQKSHLFHASKITMNQQLSHKLFNNIAITTNPSYSSTTTSALCDQSSQNSPMSLEPIKYSGLISFDLAKFYVNMESPGLEMMEDEESQCVFVRMPGLKDEDVKVYVEDNNTFLRIEGSIHDGVTYTGRMALPSNIDKTISSMKREMKDGMFKLTLRKVEVEYKELKTSIIDNMIAYFRNKLICCVPGFFDSIFSVGFMVMIEVCCREKEFSFTMYYKETAESLQIRFMRDTQKMELTREGGCVSVNMPELKKQEVKTYIKHETLVIEGKTNKVHYLTGINLPKRIMKKHDMIKTEMQDGVYKATLPYATREIKII